MGPQGVLGEEQEGLGSRTRKFTVTETRGRTGVGGDAAQRTSEGPRPPSAMRRVVIPQAGITSEGHR